MVSLISHLYFYLKPILESYGFLVNGKERRDYHSHLIAKYAFLGIVILMSVIFLSYFQEKEKEKKQVYLLRYVALKFSH